MNRRSRGFTLVELTIAITFLSILLLAILTLTVSAGRLYIKGDTNKTINQAGRDFSDVVRRDLLATGMGAITPTLTINGGSAADPLLSGRICIGTAAYLWNTAGLLNADTGAANAAKITIGASSEPIKFVRIVRPQVSYCESDALGRYPMNIPSTESATELFGGTGREFALYRMTFAPIAQNGDKGVYRVAYTLGTNEPDTTEVDDQGYIRCKPNAALLANFDYCSVSDFDMLVRIGGVE